MPIENVTTAERVKQAQAQQAETDAAFTKLGAALEQAQHGKWDDRPLHVKMAEVEARLNRAPAPHKHEEPKTIGKQ